MACWLFFVGFFLRRDSNTHNEYVTSLIFAGGDKQTMWTSLQSFFFHFLSMVGSSSLHGYDLHEKNLNKFPNFEGHGVLANLISQSKANNS